jgi:hypothetical protein
MREKKVKESERKAKDSKALLIGEFCNSAILPFPSPLPSTLLRE